MDNSLYSRVTASVEDNIKGRQTAEIIIEMAGEATKDLTPKALQRFWEIIKKHATEKLPPEDPKLEPMSPREARLFGEETLDFGKFKGEAIEDIPPDYLEWLADAQLHLYRKLVRFLASEHGAAIKRATGRGRGGRDSLKAARNSP